MLEVICGVDFYITAPRQKTATLMLLLRYSELLHLVPALVFITRRVQTQGHYYGIRFGVREIDMIHIYHFGIFILR
jgi:hypothetical protein